MQHRRGPMGASPGGAVLLTALPSAALEPLLYKPLTSRHGTVPSPLTRHSRSASLFRPPLLPHPCLLPVDLHNTRRDKGMAHRALHVLSP